MFGAFVVLTAGLLLATAINVYFRRVLRKHGNFELRKKYFAIRGILIDTLTFDRPRAKKDTK
jgi:hypothetical protein